MTISTFTDENGHTTVTVKIGCEMESMSIGAWSRLISRPISVTAPKPLTPVKEPA